MKSRGNRDKIIVVTKVGSDMGQGKKDLSAAYIEKAVEASLKRLQTEIIDLYLSHWPDSSVPYDETLGAYQQLIAKGKIRYAGASNLDAGQLAAALKIASQKSLPRYEVLQPEYNLYDRSSFDGALQRPLRPRGDRRHHLFQPGPGVSQRQIPQRGRSRQKPTRTSRRRLSQPARLAHPCSTRRRRGAAFGKAGGSGAGLGHRASRHHRADRQRHDAAAGGKPDPRCLAGARRLRRRRTGCGQRRIGRSVRPPRRVPRGA